MDTPYQITLWRKSNEWNIVQFNSFRVRLNLNMFLVLFLSDSYVKCLRGVTDKVGSLWKKVVSMLNTWNEHHRIKVSADGMEALCLDTYI